MKIIIYTRENCGNCNTVKQTLMGMPDIVVEEKNADEHQTEVQQYAPQGQWMLPLMVYFDGDAVVNVTTGIVDTDIILLPTKDLVSLKAQAYETAKTLFAYEQAHKKLQAMAKSLEKIIELKEVPIAKSEPTVVDMPTIVDPAEDTQCDSCQ